MNPTASGLINANGEVGMGQGLMIQTVGSLAGGNITPQQLLSSIVQALGGNSGITQVQADQFAAQHASGDALVSALVKLYDDNAATLTPDPLHSAFYDSHPPAALRIQRLKHAG